MQPAALIEMANPQQLQNDFFFALPAAAAVAKGAYGAHHFLRNYQQMENLGATNPQQMENLNFWGDAANTIGKVHNFAKNYQQMQNLGFWDDAANTIG
jgi:hypothetical protein